MYFSKNSFHSIFKILPRKKNTKVLDWTSLYRLFIAGSFIYPPLRHFLIIVRLMTAGRDSRVWTTAKFLTSICWLKLLMNVSRYPTAVFTQYSQSVWRINSTAGFTPQGCSIWTAATTPWRWTEGLKFDIFYFNCLAKASMFFILYWRVFQRTVSTDKTLFICKAGLTPQDVSDINNYPRSYSFND